MSTSPSIERAGSDLWWIADPAESIKRASVVLDTQEGRFAFDPVDCDGLDEQIEATGGLDGVGVLMHRHSRDAQVLADRFEVPVLVPDGAKRITDSIGKPVSSLDAVLRNTEVEVDWLVSNRFWEEVYLWRSADGTLVVPESIGTTTSFTAGGERVGTHPLMRLRPPRKQLGNLDPSRLFVGHGKPVLELEAGELRTTLRTARRKLPRAWARGIATMFSR